MTDLVALPDALDLAFRNWLERKMPRTRKLYRENLETYAKWRTPPEDATWTVRQALDELAKLTPGAAYVLVDHYRNHMAAKGLAAATINNRLAVLRSVSRVLRRAGVTTWRLDVEGVAKEARRPVDGPPWPKVVEMIAAEPSARSRAALALMAHRGLRCAEVLKVQVGDVLAGGRLRITGKGRRESETVQLAPETAGLVAAWLAERGAALGPLFDVGGSQVRRLVTAACARVGIPTTQAHPHALRHSAIERARVVMGGDVAAVRAFSRHKSVEQTMRYFDAAAEKETAAVVASRVVAS